MLYAPFALLGSRESVAGSSPARSPALALIAVVSLLAFGPHVTEAFSVAGGNQDRISRWSVPATLARITGGPTSIIFRVLAGDRVRPRSAGCSSPTAAASTGSGRPGWARFGLLVAYRVHGPLVLIWLLPLVAISRDRVLIGATILLTVFQATNGCPYERS